KLNIYKDAGVKEYWIVDPVKKLVGTYLLKNKKYRYTAFDTSIAAELPVGVLPGCVIDLKTVFG
ncbi:MAG: Uma2 family endonuclease, partial [Spirochaetaceae bacterium]|nr:Uma2 family endonuclease [Spirochaetaceae bacterium]